MVICIHNFVTIYYNLEYSCNFFCCKDSVTYCFIIVNCVHCKFLLVSSCFIMSVLQPACNDSAPTMQGFVKFDVGNFY